SSSTSSSIGSSPGSPWVRSRADPRAATRLRVAVRNSASKHRRVSGRPGVSVTRQEGRNTMANLSGMLLASTNPQRLGAWYAAVLDPAGDEMMDPYRVFDFGDFYLLIDQRDDISDTSPEPG